VDEVYNVSMYELHPYFTNDGTVGLYSPKDDDIYHSTYGALSESWEKFVIPAHLREYLAVYNEVRILDICYGIGYNTKTALNVFLDEVEKKEKNFKIKTQNKINNSKSPTLNCAAIHTDNILDNFGINFNKTNDKIQKTCVDDTICNAQLYTDNTLVGNKDESPTCSEAFALKFDNIHSLLLSEYKEIASVGDLGEDEDLSLAMTQTPVRSSSQIKNKILIDAVDSDKILIGLSPFIVNEVKNKFSFRRNINMAEFNDDKNINSNNTSNDSKNKLFQIKKMQKSQLSQFGVLKNEFKLKKEVSIILLESLLKNGASGENNLINDVVLRKILAKKKYSPYLSKSIMNLANFYSNWWCKTTKKKNISTFLHNIYYQYVSVSNKRAKKLQKNSRIDLKFHPQDARAFVQSTSSTYNFVFLDAFTPSKCPALWSLEFFNVLYSKLEDDGMILTYSNSAAIRNAFLKCGFFVGKVYNEQINKFTGTVATKNGSLIQYHLDQHDLDLINSKAGICYRDENLNCSNDEITKNRNIELSQSDLVTSSKVMKAYKKI